jgi:hypothetical protein
VAGKAFWYKVLDLMHYSHLNLTSPRRGFMVWDKSAWAQCFYKGDANTAANRAWERFKAAGRREQLFVPLPGDEHGRCVGDRINERVVIRVEPTQDAIYAALGAPHPAGLHAQVRCEREQRDDLLPVIVLGIAAAARVEQQRRKVG